MRWSDRAGKGWSMLAFFPDRRNEKELGNYSTNYFNIVNKLNRSITIYKNKIESCQVQLTFTYWSALLKKQKQIPSLLPKSK